MSLRQILGAALASGSPMRVTARDTAVYAANVMARDAGAGALGDADPDFTLQPGAPVTTAGDPVKNAHGVAYTPVTVPGHDAPFFIRSSSLGPAGGVVVTTTTHVEKLETPWWQWVLLAVGGSAVAYGGYKLVKEAKRRRR